ncbi:MAG: hypothetical protein IJ600_06210 [Lachnospiraceae bacterium]|nr:hypothetical protein [Lachnospiraceae bacterium]
MKHIDELTVQATEGLTDTMARLDTIDLEKLNTAIGNLNATIEPLANFFGVLSR